ncbi:hypothetical protein [Neolewinella antarctica]|uniref:Uncharacterized protein n=1 Tax=Neolewinella antarctica TaxID=442734 RepID=A0ABX0XAP3_9BACT|nr:hypothetical protein [Neolewinella antarctica]NJC26009.1 hypothetical protein [Neolewinella antarctica]
MRTLFSLLFLALAFVLAFFLYKSIEEPINFDAQRTVRTDAVTMKLEMIRKAQELYRDATGEFAGSFDTLKQVLTEGKLLNVKVIGDADATDGSIVTYDTTYIPLRDTFPGLGIKLENMDVVPYTDGQVKFNIEAKNIPYQSTNVPVVQVGVKKSAFMGKYADERFKRYDQMWDPNAPIYFGDLTKPTLAGNWN